MSTLSLRNPHSVFAALRHRPHDVLSIRVTRASATGNWRDVVDLARQHRVAVHAERSAPTTRSGPKDRRTGTAEADVKPRSDVSLEELFVTDADGQRLWVALDHLQDPHNVGAIFRTAAFFGVAGIVLTRDRSAPLTSTVYDVASGGLESVPFSEQTNLARTIDVAKQAGLWVLGTSEHAAQDIANVPRDRNWLVVVGNEEKGLGPLIRKKCDDMCCLTQLGEVSSLNVSVATGILIASLLR